MRMEADRFSMLLKLGGDFYTEGGESLDAADGMRASSVVLRQLNILIAAHEAHAMGQLTETLWTRTKADAAFLKLPGPRPYLLLHLRLFPSSLIADVFGDKIAAEVGQSYNPISPVPPAAQHGDEVDAE